MSQEENTPQEGKRFQECLHHQLIIAKDHVMFHIRFAREKS